VEQNFKLWDNAEKKIIEVIAKKTGQEWRAFCPFHNDVKTPNLYINAEKRVYYCFVCEAKGHLYEPGFTDKKKMIEAIYDYKDGEGELFYQVVRYEGKDFRQRRPDGAGGFIWNLEGVKRIIYNLPEIIKKPEKPIFIPEGEKNCNDLGKIGLLSTTNSGGAGKWRAEFNRYLRGRDVILLPDNDEKGYRHSRDIGNNLKGIAKSIRWLILPKLKKGNDVSDWLEQGGNLEEIFELLKIAPEFSTIKEPITERKLVNVYDLLESDIPEEEMIVGRGLIPKVGFGLIGGLAKEGKTLLALQFSLSLVSGNHFLEEFPVIKKCKVCYLYHENTLQGLNKIIKKLLSGFKDLGVDISREDLKNFHFWNGKDLVLELKKNPDIGDLKRDLELIKPDIIFLDPLGQYIGFDINKAENIKRLTDLLREIYNCFWVVIHHYIKPKSLAKGERDIPPIYKLLGSSYLANSCETFLGLEPEGENYPSNFKKIYFVLRRESEPLPMHLKRDSKNLFYETLDSVSLLRGKVKKEDIVRILKKSFKGKASYKDLALLCSQELGVSESRIAHKIREAKEAGIIAKEEGKKGCWYIKDAFSTLF